MFDRRRLTVIALVLLLVTAGCAASGGGDAAQSADGGDGARGGDAGLAAEPEPGETGTDAGDSPPAVRDRRVIRTGSVSLEVDDFDAARRNLTTAAEASGGFVSDTSQRRHRVGNETYTTGELVIRVPRSNFSGLMARIEAEGTLEASTTTSEDVTDQLVDLEARLGNLRSQRDQLRDLYARANDTEDVLAVQERLSAVQTEIERLEARQQLLERRVALSTIRVEFAEPRPTIDRPDRDRWYDTGVIAAFLESVDGVGVVLRAMVVAGAYALPYVLAFGAPIAATVGFVLWRRRQ